MANVVDVAELSVIDGGSSSVAGEERTFCCGGVTVEVHFRNDAVLFFMLCSSLLTWASDLLVRSSFVLMMSINSHMRLSVVLFRFFLFLRRIRTRNPEIV